MLLFMAADIGRRMLRTRMHRSGGALGRRFPEAMLKMIELDIATLKKAYEGP